MSRQGGRGPDVRQVMQQAAEMQAEMQRRQEALASRTFEGSAGGGVVTAVVAGDGELRRIDIDPSVLDPGDPEMVGDLVVAAVAQAQALVSEAVTETLGGLGGLDLSGLTGG